ncbi:ATP-binding protein [Actinomadura citrea]|uniref:ATP-binding protein n=1 Tax=Actinomadura citrea TaxID=46158 RepID=UPI002E29B563|nr:ATP-binding protein [Actinomadura citrea]
MIYLKAEPASVKVARDYAGKIAAEGWPVDEYTVRLVTTELVTNAVRHARTELFTVNARLYGNAYAVEVWDGDKTLPVLQEIETLGEGGWGLRAVAEYVTRWGIRFDESGGKTVFAEWEAL